MRCSIWKGLPLPWRNIRAKRILPGHMLIQAAKQWNMIKSNETTWNYEMPLLPYSRKHRAFKNNRRDISAFLNEVWAIPQHTLTSCNILRLQDPASVSYLLKCFKSCLWKRINKKKEGGPPGSKTLQWRSANCWSRHSVGGSTWPCNALASTPGTPWFLFWRCFSRYFWNCCTNHHLPGSYIETIELTGKCCEVLCCSEGSTLSKASKSNMPWRDKATGFSGASWSWIGWKMRNHDTTCPNHHTSSSCQPLIIDYH